MNELSDLLTSAADNVASRNELIERAAILMWRYLAAHYSNVSYDTRQDIVQDLAMRLLERGLKQFRGSTEHEWRYYLYRMVRNRVIDLLRGARDELPPDALIGPESDSPERATESEQRLHSVRLCMSDLSDIDQQIFWLRAREYAYEEIVERLQIPLGTVATKYQRTRDKIIDCLRRAGILPQHGKKTGADSSS